MAALGDGSGELRVGAFEALTRLPLAPATWTDVGAYCARVVASGGSTVERLAVIDGAPWVPLRWIQDLVARLAADGAGEIRARAARASAVFAEARSSPAESVESPLRPRWADVEPPGFVNYSAAEMKDGQRVVFGLGLTVDADGGASASSTGRLRGEAVESVHGLGLAPIAVTALFEGAARDRDTLLGNDLVQWVERIQGRFRPNLEGLFAVYQGQAVAVWHAWTAAGRPHVIPAFFDPGIEEFGRWLCWQVAWTVSRGGLRGLVPGLARHLSSDVVEERLAAACLVADVADYVVAPEAPSFGGGFGPERSLSAGALLDDADPKRPEWPGLRAPVVAEPAVPEQESSLDDDVQFTVYRPRVVRPQRWNRLVVFAHKTTPVEDVDGSVLDPLREVSRQADEALRDEPLAFAPVAVDSAEVLHRGSELLFEPWLEEARLDPERAWLRWEEPVHQVLFRFRVPAEADGRRLKGGLRVFLGVVLIGEVRFQITVSATTPVETRSPDPVGVTRYRQIFASYSHKDSDLVRKVADYLSVTGDRYFIDVQTLRSGERWEQRLTELIDQADVFQLFWSANAMRSVFVRREWEYALTLGREGFIRPVYWEDPLPEDPGHGLPPDALRRFHFARLPIHDVPTTPAPSVPAGGATITCRQCGFRNRGDDEFCGSCGSFLEWTGEKIATPPSSRPVDRERETTTGPVAPPSPPGTDGNARPDRPAAVQPQAPKRPMAKIESHKPTQRLRPGDLVCSQCGEGNAPARRFCSRCGSSLAEAETVGEKWWQKLIPKRKQKVLEAGQRPARQPVTKKRRLPRRGLAIRLLVVAVILCLLYLLFIR